MFCIFATLLTTSYRGLNIILSGLKIGDMVKVFDGAGDVSVWFKKLKLVVQLQK